MSKMFQGMKATFENFTFSTFGTSSSKKGMGSDYTLGFQSSREIGIVRRESSYPIRIGPQSVFDNMSDTENFEYHERVVLR